MKWFGWMLVGAACGLLCLVAVIEPKFEISAHVIMGFFFGLLHVAYGIYLYLTQEGKNAA